MLEYSDMSVRRAINTRAPVQRLPSELLIRIFSLVPGPYQFEGQAAAEPLCHSYSIMNTKQLLPLISVCRLWHEYLSYGRFSAGIRPESVWPSSPCILYCMTDYAYHFLLSLLSPY
ncbi:hypothetical protein C8Q74DRAFT_1276196 [Fomes fomentarius]|nr:hypothetical protein C8Q74DRAFT_1276196 [Fomes fomentarius]